MGNLGVIPATQKALEKAKLKVDQVDVFEVNEGIFYFFLEGKIK